MTKPRAYVLPLPLSAVPELRAFLEPFLGREGKRSNVVMVRLGDEPVARLDGLVEAGLFGSRSEAAAFLIGAGIRAQRPLLDKLAGESAELRRMRSALRQKALRALKETVEDMRPPRKRKGRGGRTEEEP